jgi:hypothetical protein
LDPENLTIVDGGNTGGINDPTGDVFVDASVIDVALSSANTSVTLMATNDITFLESISGTGSKSGLTATAGRNLVVEDGVTIATNNGAINFTADSDRNGTGFLTLGVGSKLTTKGAAVNLTVDHGSAASNSDDGVNHDGMSLLGDIDTRTSATGFGAASTFQVLGTNADQKGVITVGTVRLDAGQDGIAGSATYWSYGTFTLRADEINLTGGAGSVTGTGGLEFRQANTDTGFKLAGNNNDTPKQLDFTTAELEAVGENGFSGFMGLSFGRTGSTAELIIGEVGDTGPLILGRSVAGPTYLTLYSSVKGVISNVAIQAPGVVYSNIYGDVIDVKKGFSAPNGVVSLFQAGNSNIEILDMTKTGQHLR